jgi:hypothetical protein
MFNKVLAYIARETAQIAAVVAGLIQLIGALTLGFTVDEQGALNALVVVLLGVLTALSVSAEKAAPLIAGVVQAMLAVALSFGFQLTPQLQGSIMAFVVAVVAFYLRTVVTAPIGPDAVSRGGRHVLS